MCVVTGPPVTKPYWRTMNAYTLAATNPVYLDADGDGTYRSPRESAQALIDRVGTDPARLLPALRRHDRAVAVQVAAIARKAYQTEALEKLRSLATGDSPHLQALKDYVGSVPESREE